MALPVKISLIFLFNFISQDSIASTLCPEFLLPIPARENSSILIGDLEIRLDNPNSAVVRTFDRIIKIGKRRGYIESPAVQRTIHAILSGESSFAISSEEGLIEGATWISRDNYLVAYVRGVASGDFAGDYSGPQLMELMIARREESRVARGGGGSWRASPLLAKAGFGFIVGALWRAAALPGIKGIIIDAGLVLEPRLKPLLAEMGFTKGDGKSLTAEEIRSPMGVMLELRLSFGGQSVTAEPTGL